MKAINLILTEDEHAALKTLVAQRRTTIQAFVHAKVIEVIDEHGKPYRQITDAKLMEVSLVPDTPGNRAAGAQFQTKVVPNKKPDDEDPRFDHSLNQDYRPVRSYSKAQQAGKRK